jgi:zinc transport system substrate-binding protein
MTAAVLLLGFCLGCGGGDSRDATAPSLAVASSLPPHAWLVERLGGEAVASASVLGPTDSPATYQPDDAQVSRLLSSRLFFRAGVPFESSSWFEAFERSVPVVDLRDGVPLRPIAEPETLGEGHNHHHGALDPHIWLSPTRLILQAKSISAALQELDPGRGEFYSARLAQLATELGDLDRWIRDVLAPHHGRTFVVFHPSWGYFASDYGLRQLAIEVDGKVPSDAEISGLQRRARELGITVVFVQPQIAGQSLHAVAGSLGARVETLDPLAPDVIANLRHTTTKIAGSFDG